MKEFNLRRFITIAVVSVVVLSLIWTLTGKYYTVLMVQTLSPFLPGGTMLNIEDNNLSLTVRRDVIPVKITATGEDGEVSLAQSTVDISDPEAREYWLAILPRSTARAYTSRLDPRVIQSGMIPAVSLMLALPIISYGTHLFGLFTIVIASFIGHIVSLYLIIQRYEWLANHSLQPRHENDAVLVTGYYFGLSAPLMVLVVIIFFKWRRDNQNR